MEDVPAQGEVEDRLIANDVLDEKTPNGITSVETPEDVAETLDNPEDVASYEERQRLAAEEQAKAAEDLGGLDDDGMDDIITLTSCDETPVPFKLTRRCLVGDKDKELKMTCNLVKNIVEGDKTAGVEDEIEVKKVSAETLGLIVEYLEHHNGAGVAEIAKPIRSVKMEKIVEDQWDAVFINKQTKKVIFQIILGANYMDIKQLLHLGCAKIATLIKGKSPDEIKKILGDDKEIGKMHGDGAFERRRLLNAMSNF